MEPDLVSTSATNDTGSHSPSDPLQAYLKEILGEEEDFANLDPETLKHTFEQVADRHAKRLLRDLNRKRSKMIKEQKAFRKGFEDRLHRLWGDALDKLEMLVVSSQEAGEQFIDKRTADGFEDDDYVLEALLRIHVRSVLTAREILVLLRGGYAAGAHARWRTLHELVVVGRFLVQNGKETAERYILHKYIDSYKALEPYRQHHTQLGLEPIEAEEIRKIKDVRDALVKRFGDDFAASEYGWAAQALGIQRPNIAQIEDAAGLTHFRPWYRMSSHPIHAGSKGIYFNLGVFPRQDGLLAGPSNGGLADPGQVTAISLGQITATFLQPELRPENMLVVRTLLLLVDEIQEAFMKAHWEWVDKTKENLNNEDLRTA